MSGSGGKPPSGSQPGRPAADTPQRLVVRSLDGGSDSLLGANDTAVAVAHANTSNTMTALETPAAGTPALLPRADSPDLVGATLSGRYLVTRKVGQGGMGIVYEATHTVIGRRIAVKVLLEKYARREQIVQRLVKEARLASSIGNEHIIDMMDSGQTEDGRTFVVMEFLEGESLAECLAREHRLPEQRILRLIAQAASALAAAHAKGVVHRDIKPENLFILRRKDQDFIKVVDFGISKSLRTEDEEESTRLTQTGMVLGTPLYMSPEQARGDDELDHRVDIYALGVIMYEISTGRVPFAGTNYLSVISQVLNEDPVPLRELCPELSEEFEAIVQRAMAKDRRDRYADANEMLADLNALIDDPTRSTERAKITGPRRKAAGKRGPARIVWVAGVAVIVAAIAVTVKMTMGGSSGASGSTAPVAAVPADAAVATVTADAAAVEPPADAAPAEPELVMVAMTIESEPAGATIYMNGTRLDGTTPMTVEVIRRHKDIEFAAELDGYDATPFSQNPIELPADRTVRVKLIKPKKGVAPKQLKHLPRPDDKGSAAPPRPRDKTGGELSGDPFGAKP